VPNDCGLGRKEVKVGEGNCWITRAVGALLLVVILTAGCGGGGASAPSAPASDQVPTLTPVALGAGEHLQVVATTSFVADVVRTIGGDRVDVIELMPLGADPHDFQPTPQDAAVIGNAHAVFINGAGLETFIARLLANAGENTPVVPVSYGVDLLTLQEGANAEDDPHVWFDPNNVKTWVANIRSALSALDPDGAATYGANADAYLSDLDALDAWIQDQVATVPQDRRKLVTDHSFLAYFAAAYGFEQVGMVTEGSSTLSEPSARELASLEDAIRAQHVPAIFVGTTVNPRIAQQIAQDVGVKVAALYTGSLSEPGGPAATYLEFMRYDVSTITDALASN
jgi:ABC-type Zn uptake system ZnuABC Zn-binding protein ZnuA